MPARGPGLMLGEPPLEGQVAEESTANGTTTAAPAGASTVRIDGPSPDPPAVLNRDESRNTTIRAARRGTGWYPADHRR